MITSLVGCASNGSKPQKLGATNNDPLGWSENKGNLTFNSGPLKRDFPNSPVGKVWYYFFDEDEDEIPIVDTTTTKIKKEQ